MPIASGANSGASLNAPPCILHASCATVIATDARQTLPRRSQLSQTVAHYRAIAGDATPEMIEAERLKLTAHPASTPRARTSYVSENSILATLVSPN